MRTTDLQHEPSQPDLFIEDKEQSYMVPPRQTLTGKANMWGNVVCSPVVFNL